MSPLVPSQVPEHLHGDAPLFGQFLETYYKYASQRDKAIGTIQNHASEMDIDETSDTGLDHFYAQYGEFFPKDVALDKRNFVKLFNKIYEAKGTEKALKLVFKILFNDSIEVKYPSEQILRASGGIWTQDSFITLETQFGALPSELPYTLNVTNDFGDYGLKVSRVASVDTITNRFYYRSFEKVVFFDGQVVTITNDDGDVIYAGKMIKTASKLVVKEAGKGWQVGQVIVFPGSIQNTIARVTSINSEGGISGLEIVDYGYKHEEGQTLVISPYPNRPASSAIDIETQSVGMNLFTKTEKFDDAVWTKNFVTITPNAILAPNGTTTADKLSENNSADRGWIGSTVDPVVSGEYISVHAKAGEWDRVCLGISDGGVTWGVVNFNLSTGTIGANTSYGGAVVDNATMTPLGNGWYRCAVRASTVLTTFPVIMPFNQNGDPVNPSPGLTGNGTSGIYIWGAQLETGSLAPYQSVDTEGSGLNTLHHVITIGDETDGCTESIVGVATAQNADSYFLSDYVVTGYLGNKVIGVLTTNAPPSSSMEDGGLTIEEWLESRANLVFESNYVVKTKGMYYDDSGKLSNQEVKLQDNYYYQPFSYVINTTKDIKEYEKVLGLTHPAGAKRFSEVRKVLDYAFDFSASRSISVDILTVLDTVTMGHTNWFSLSKVLASATGTSTDAYTVSFSKALTDSVTSDDALNGFAVGKALDDSVTEDDTYTVSLIKPLTDSATADSSSTITFLKALDETVTGTDATVQTLNKPINDSVSADQDDSADVSTSTYAGSSYFSEGYVENAITLNLN